MKKNKPKILQKIFLAILTLALGLPPPTPIPVFAQEITPQDIQTTTITNDNNAKVENNLNAEANTGDNSVTSTPEVETSEAVASDSAGTIQTGSVSAQLNLINIVETNLTGTDSGQAIVNLFTASDEDINLSQIKNQGNLDPALADILSSFSIYDAETATLSTVATVSADTGGTSVNGDDFSLQTGSASAELNLFNLVNTNLTGNNWFFGVINLFNQLHGDIVLPYELQFLNPDASNSTNQTNSTGNTSFTVANNNEANLTNNLNVLADSGNNIVLGSGNIQTGSAAANINLLNIVNTNITGSGWLLLIIHNFGSWTGKIVGGQGNTLSLPDAASATPDTAVNNNNTVSVTNNLEVTANTGNNAVQGEDAGIQTGDTQAGVNVANIVNTNILGNNWFLGIINIFDGFSGDIIFPRPDLAITKTADKSTAQPGENIAYTITVKNQGKVWAKNIIITDTLPGNATFVSASNAGSQQNGIVTWNFFEIWPEQSQTLTVTVRLNDGVGCGQSIVNTALTSTQTDEPNQSNNSASLTLSTPICREMPGHGGGVSGEPTGPDLIGTGGNGVTGGSETPAKPQVLKGEEEQPIVTPSGEIAGEVTEERIGYNNPMLTILFILLQLAFAVFFFYLCLAFITGAPFVPSTGKTAQKMIKLARLKPGMKVYDLGSGEGRLLFLAAAKGAVAVGFEINPLLVIFTAIKIFFSPYRCLIRVRWQNFWKAEFSDAEVVFIYLLPWKMNRLQHLLKTQLKKGTLVVSNSFIFPNWKILRQDRKTHVYVFKIPARV